MDYLEQLLGKLDDVEARAEFSELASKHPVLKDWIFDPEIRTKSEEVSTWAANEWDYDHGMSKLEYQQQQEIAALTAKGNGMELNELNEYLGKYIKENKLMTQADYDAAIREKEAAFGQELNLVSTLATRIPYLNAQYQKDFGEMFDPDVFVREAGEKGFSKYGKDGLDEFYKVYTADKRTAKSEAEQTRLLAEAEERGRKKALAESGMGGASGAGPALDGAPEMSHFEARMRGQSARFDPAVQSAPADAELGRGIVSRFAAQAAEYRERTALTQ